MREAITPSRAPPTVIPATSQRHRRTAAQARRQSKGSGPASASGRSSAARAAREARLATTGGGRVGGRWVGGMVIVTDPDTARAGPDRTPPRSRRMVARRAIGPSSVQGDYGVLTQVGAE